MTRALFVADLHLAAERPQTSGQFFRFLEEEAARANALYILGDLFEYWAGDDDLSDPFAAEVAAALRSLSENGVRVNFMHGNRDFLLGAGFSAAAGARLMQDPAVVELGSGPTLIMHGDALCTDDHDYQAWRRSARSAEWQREFLSKNLVERRKAMLDLREKSKEIVASKTADTMDVNPEAVKDAFRRHRVRRLIHGHTHRPAHHRIEVDGALCERWVLPDWYGRGGYLALDDVGPRLVSF